MRIFSSDQFAYPLPSGHRFPQQKYAELRRRVEASGLPGASGVETPEEASVDQLLLAHDEAYLGRVLSGALAAKEVRRIGLPWSPELVVRCRRTVGGTIAACRAAMVEGLAVNLAGGTHHAFSDHGQGYCLLNDVAIAARVMQRDGPATRIVIVDCDVHQGNGTAAIFRGDASVFTFSIHGAKNFPFLKEQSDLDVALPDRADDAAYLEELELGLEMALSRAEADLAIYLAGADPFAGDTLGRLSLSKGGLSRRDRMVHSRCRSAGLPVAVVMAGGYGRVIADTVDIHLETVRIAAELSGSR